MSLEATDALAAPSEREAAPKPSPSRTARRAVSTRAISAATLVALLALWQVSASYALVPKLFLPAPVDVLHQFIAVARDGFVDATLGQHLAASLGRVFAALAFTIAIGVPVGIAIGTTRIGRGLLDPVIELIRPIPPLAYLPLVVIWFGIGEPSKILIIAIAMLAPIVIATASGVRGVSTVRLNAARALGATRGQLLRHVIVPSALPAILTGIRIALGTGWSTLVAAELVAASRGLGFMIQSAAQFLVTDVVVMGILVIAAVAFALEALIRFLERRFVPWSGRL